MVFVVIGLCEFLQVASPCCIGHGSSDVIRYTKFDIPEVCVV